MWYGSWRVCLLNFPLLVGVEDHWQAEILFGSDWDGDEWIDDFEWEAAVEDKVFIKGEHGAADDDVTPLAIGAGEDIAEALAEL
jgi:hypothetical protein